MALVQTIDNEGLIIAFCNEHVVDLAAITIVISKRRWGGRGRMDSKGNMESWIQPVTISMKNEVVSLNPSFKGATGLTLLLLSRLVHGFVNNLYSRFWESV